MARSRGGPYMAGIVHHGPRAMTTLGPVRMLSAIRLRVRAEMRREGDVQRALIFDQAGQRVETIEGPPDLPARNPARGPRRSARTGRFVKR